jgi:hypothetical protein
MSPVTRIQKAAVSDQLPGVTVCFQPQPQQSRFDVIVSTPVGQQLSDDLNNALQAIGFKPVARQAPAVNGMVSQAYEGEGYGLGGGWSTAERERYNGQARRTLRRFGFTMVPEIPAEVRP